VTPEGRLLRSYLLTPAPIKGFLEDYACLAWGHLELYRAEHQQHDLERSASLCQQALHLFSTSDGRLTTAGSDAEQLPMALPDLHDGVIPSGVSVLATNLIQLAELTSEPHWSDDATALLQSYRDNLQQAPVNSLWLLQAGLDWETWRKT